MQSFLHSLLAPIAAALGIVVVAVLAASASWAQAPATDVTTIRLVCKITSSLDDEPGLDKASGEDVLTIVHAPDGVAVMNIQGLGVAKFVGRVTEEEIVGEAAYVMNSRHIRDKITINRFTAEYVRHLDITEGGGLVFFGKCAPAQRLF